MMNMMKQGHFKQKSKKMFKSLNCMQSSNFLMNFGEASKALKPRIFYRLHHLSFALQLGALPFLLSPPLNTLVLLL